MLRNLVLFAIAPVLLVILNTALEAGDEKPAVKLDPLAAAGKGVGGEWVAEPGHEDPRLPHGRFKVEYGMGKKLLNDKTFWFTKGEGNQIYEGATYYHPGKKQVVFYQVAKNGELYEGTISEEEGVSVSKWTAYSADKTTEYKQTSKYLDNDTLESTVFVKEGDDWKVMHTFKFHRKASGWDKKEK
jgi:hypothetical protein